MTGSIALHAPTQLYDACGLSVFKGIAFGRGCGLPGFASTPPVHDSHAIPFRLSVASVSTAGFAVGGGEKVASGGGPSRGPFSRFGGSNFLSGAPHFKMLSWGLFSVPPGRGWSNFDMRSPQPIQSPQPMGSPRPKESPQPFASAQRVVSLQPMGSLRLAETHRASLGFAAPIESPQLMATPQHRHSATGPFQTQITGRLSRLRGDSHLVLSRGPTSANAQIAPSSGGQLSDGPVCPM